LTKNWQKVTILTLINTKKVIIMSHSHIGHGHSHGGRPCLSIDGKKKPDGWTRWNQLGEFIEALGVANYLKNTVENSKDLLEWSGVSVVSSDDNTYKYTLTALTIAIAMLLALGAAECHKVLNTQYQDDLEESEADEDEEEHHHHHEEGEHKGHYHTLDAEEGEEQHSPPRETLHYTAVPLIHDEEKEPPSPNSDKDEPEVHGLSLKQKYLLGADGICHGLGKAGSVMGIVDSFTEFVMPGANAGPIFRLVSQCSATLFGGVTAVAEVRTCRKALLNDNKQNHEEKVVRLR
jgi:hypothetical protein